MISQVDGYHVTLGANNNKESTVTYLHGMENELLAEAQTPDILHCFQLRKFWISWKINGLDMDELRVGSGSYGNNTFLSATLKGNFDIQLISFTASGQSEWQMEESQGENSLQIKTQIIISL